MYFLMSSRQVATNHTVPSDEKSQRRQSRYEIQQVKYNLDGIQTHNIAARV